MAKTFSGFGRKYTGSIEDMLGGQGISRLGLTHAASSPVIERRKRSAALLR